MVVPTFIKQALTGRPITIHGDGTQSRCFTDVSDIVSALVALMDHPAAVGDVFNIGSSEEVLIEALAQRVKMLTGSSSEIVISLTRKPTARVSRTCPGGSRISPRSSTLIGYHPRKSLDAILGGVIDYFRDAPSAAGGAETTPI